MTTFTTRLAPTSDSSVTLKAVRPAKAPKGARVKKFLNTLMRSLASAHA